MSKVNICLNIEGESESVAKKYRVTNEGQGTAPRAMDKGKGKAKAIQVMNLASFCFVFFFVCFFISCIKCTSYLIQM